MMSVRFWQKSTQDGNEISTVRCVTASARASLPQYLVM